MERPPAWLAVVKTSAAYQLNDGFTTTSLKILAGFFAGTRQAIYEAGTHEVLHWRRDRDAKA
jgi:hypothetical protein